MPKVLVLLIAVALAGGVACSQDTQSVTPPTDLAASSSPTSSPSIYVPVSHSPKPPKPSTVAPVVPISPAPFSPAHTVAPTKAPSTTVLFTSPGKKYTLRYLKTWSASKKTSGTDLRIFDKQSGGAADIWSLSEPVTAGTSTSAILADGVTQLSSFGISNVKKKDSAKATLDGQPAQLVTYTGTTAGSGSTISTVSVMQLASKNKTTGIVLSLTAKPKVLTQFVPTFQNIINSFVFLTTK